ncbi:O-succinylbenzoate synthase, partial [Rothia nasimurium]
MPPLEEILSATRVVALPMRVKFRGVSLRETALIQGPG